MNKYLKAVALVAFFAIASLYNGQTATAAVEIKTESLVSAINIPLLANYVNPYTSEGQRALSSKMGDTWSWFLVSLVSLLVLIIAILMMVRIKLNQFGELQRAKVAAEQNIDYQEKSTWWEIFVKAEKDRPLDSPIEGHDYDGIVELDNNPPSWFNWLFFLPIGFGIIYVMYYHVLDIAPLQDGEYAASVAIAEENMPEIVIDYASLEPLSDASALESGRGIFTANCAACHLASGAGSVGPNLTDKFWIHGGDFGSIYKTIYEGVDGKGMAAWGEILLSEDIHKVSSYLETLRNTNVDGGKAPEGNEYTP